MYNKRTLLIDHVKEHATIYIFMMILFLTGVIFGAIIVNSMDFVQKQDLFFYLERFFGDIADEEQLNSNEILKSSFFYHVKYLFMLFVLGLSVIGLPVVWILLFLKGLVVGFSVGFIVNQLGLDGLFLASLSIAPQNLLVIPIYIIAGSLSMLFSLTLLRKLFSRRISQPILQPFGKYAAVFASLMVLSLAAAALEAYMANEAMEMLIKSLYNN
ncbi:stage II sporulation protein M [Lentibacillus halodurans]|uniref:Stage II sporulation protein M n=1 Tax=Lentibacillus halodurans TaxID=237679 RepID=A0A1I0V8Q5_9BACI|nr:stage II sporulation protein M [Lentibacillus halodurans]SFA72632.1 stage II sporulation protein M [Lentibacillus halodurans]